MDKKAVEPLIAAVLLIVVVVGIGAVVTGIVRSYVSENKQIIEKSSTDVDCSTGVSINVPSDDDRLWICHNNNTRNINVTVENVGSLPIDDFQIKVFGSLGMNDNESLLASPLNPGQTTKLSIVYPSSVGIMQEVRIVPKKQQGSNRIFCTESALKFAATDISC